MRRVCLTLSLLAMGSLLTGCSAMSGSPCCSTTGWSFQVGRPSTLTVATPTVINQQSGPVGVQPLGALAGTSNTVIHTPPAMPPAASYQDIPRFKGPGVITGSADACTQQAICDKLDKVLDLLGAKREE